MRIRIIASLYVAFVVLVAIGGTVLYIAPSMNPFGTHRLEAKTVGEFLNQQCGVATDVNVECRFNALISWSQRPITAASK
jgi:hypothetical protein